MNTLLYSKTNVHQSTQILSVVLGHVLLLFYKIFRTTHAFLSVLL